MLSWDEFEQEDGAAQLVKATALEPVKTYLRALAATTTEKSTVSDNSLNKVSSGAAAVPLACSLDDPECEACQ